MKSRRLLIVALIVVLFSTLYNQEETPFKHVKGTLKIYRD